MEKIKQILKSLSKTDIAAITLIPAMFIYLFVIAGFEGTITDEAFYISVPLRLINGDGLFTDEWHLSQLSAVLLYPAVRVFTAITGSTAGIVLFMRRLFAVFQFVTGAYIYKSLRKEGIPAIIISLSFMSFSVIGLNALSYNTLGVGLLFIICVTAYNLFNNPSGIKMAAIGFLTAAFILCQPIGIIFYIIYFATVCIFNLLKNKKGNVPFPFTFRSLLMTIAGILPVFIFFLVLLFKNSDIATIIKCIPGILSDVEHMELTKDLGIKTFSGTALFVDMTMAAGTVPLIIAAICICLSVIFKKKDRYAATIIASAGLALFVLVFFYRLFLTEGTTETDDINFFFLPLSLSGIVFYLIAEKKNHKAFILFWCTGMLYAVFMTVSSNLRLHASVNGYIVASAGTLILANELISEFKEKINISEENKNKKSKPAEKVSSLLRPAIISVIVSVFAFSVFQTGAVCCTQVLSRFSFPSAKVNYGAYAGIILPSDQTLMHKNIYKDAQMIKQKVSSDDRLFVVENLSVAYLDTGMDMGAFSGWFIADQLSIPEIRERFREYYEINPDNIPDYIYVPAYVYGKEGFRQVPPKIQARNAGLLFEGETEALSSGLLIKVTGIKNEKTENTAS